MNIDDDENDRYESGLDEWRKLPVFRQGVVILHLIEHIIEGIKLDDPTGSSHYKLALYERYTQKMMDNALLIPSAIATAHSADLYDLKMENATLVRKAAREIITDTRGLLALGYREVEYLELLTNAIENFRPKFARWIQTFNPQESIVDRWGLFNPPGVNFDDAPDQISFNITSFLRELDDDWDDHSDDDELI